jgi:hypothetical protein
MTKYLIFVFSFLIIVSCATPLKDTCFQYPNQKPLCKNDIKGLPDDFPDNLFLKWITQKPVDQRTIGPFPVITWGEIDNGNVLVEAILLFKVVGNKKRAFAMIEAKYGKAEVVWVSKEATELDKILLDLFIHDLNQEATT